MTEKPYSNREIDAKHHGIHEKLDTIIGDNVEIKEQVRFTNGKVKKIIVGLAVAFGLIIGMGVTDFSQVLAIFI
jgi:hypothetical protein